MLTPREKTNTIKDIRLHNEDSGSAPVQIALLTRRINDLLKHLKSNRQDNHSRRGLLKMVSNRKKFLNYLAKKDVKTYKKIVKKLGLKDKADL